MGGIAGVAPEWRPLRRLFLTIDYGIWTMSRKVYEWFQQLTGAESLRASSDIELRHDNLRRDNALLGAIFLGAFGFTAHLGLNVIYDAALTCVVVGAYIAWYRPRLRWQVWAGGLIFTVIYAVVLVLTGWRYPTFYNDHWNLTALSGIRIVGAPLEVRLCLCDGSVLGPALRVMAQRTPVTDHAAPPSGRRLRGVGCRERQARPAESLARAGKRDAHSSSAPDAWSSTTVARESPTAATARRVVGYRTGGSALGCAAELLYRPAADDRLRPASSSASQALTSSVCSCVVRCRCRRRASGAWAP